MFFRKKVTDLFVGYKIISTFASLKMKDKMIQNFTYILLCGIIILLAKFGGSESCA